MLINVKVKEIFLPPTKNDKKMIKGIKIIFVPFFSIFILGISTVKYQLKNKLYFYSCEMDNNHIINLPFGIV